MSVKEVMTSLADAVRGRYSVTNKLTVTDMIDLINSENIDVAKLIDRSIDKIDVVEGVTTIGENAFRGCSQLTTVTLPRSIESIGDNAFAECGNLTNVWCDFYKDTVVGYPWGADASQTSFEFLDNKPLTFTARTPGSRVTIHQNGSVDLLSGVEARIKGEPEFNEVAHGTSFYLENVGDFVQFRNTNTSLSTGPVEKAPDDPVTEEDRYVYFTMTGSVAASGNIQSMLNYSKRAPMYCFYKLFEGCRSLVTAPELPATKLEEACYLDMFRDTSLTQAPELPATELASYCYYGMFSDTSLTQAPELPATELASYCYKSMFADCTSLRQAPELPAIALESGCYSHMFSGCSNLQTITVAFEEWVEGATTNWVTGVASNGVFNKSLELEEKLGNSYIPGSTLLEERNWEIVNVYRPEITDPLTIEYTGPTNFTIYPRIEVVGSPNVSGLKYRTSRTGEWLPYAVGIDIPINTSSPIIQFCNTSDKLSIGVDSYVFLRTDFRTKISGNVQSLLGGIKRCPEYCFYRLFMSIESDMSGLYLPATRLADSCYSHMFVNSSIKNITLPAKTLAQYCYQGMLSDCKKLESVQIDATTLADHSLDSMMYYSNVTNISVAFTSWRDNSTNYWVAGVPDAGVFEKPRILDDLRDRDKIPEGWTVVNKD